MRNVLLAIRYTLYSILGAAALATAIVLLSESSTGKLILRITTLVLIAVMFYWWYDYAKTKDTECETDRTGD